MQAAIRLPPAAFRLRRQREARRQADDGEASTAPYRAARQDYRRD
jgi:hypothetical protein